MNIKIYRPICFFDIEATGINIVKDRIIEISFLKLYPNKINKDEKTWLVYPEMPIPNESTAIHGIKDSDVINMPTFKSISKDIYNLLNGCDLVGYNSNRFDIPLLAEELLRAGLSFDFNKHNTIDVQVIFHKMEPRTLKAAYQYYCKKDLKKSHSSRYDTLATYEILQAQLDKYKNLKNDVKSLNDFSNYKNKVDLVGFIITNEFGDEVFNFGKYKGLKVVDVFKKDLGYYSWIQNADFPLYTKKVLTRIKLREIKK